MLLYNMIVKYRVRERDIYNFNKTSFIISIITILIVVIYTNKYSKVKSI
ncbi:transposase [Colletotrichum musicola]|uniref:Transposase n=1 Tax=Colletotrichum musicola TaxID=2175873 RepID=A0A8H6N3H7_9PEZI|nr:transposase [Colletotrichum musicola]